MMIRALPVGLIALGVVAGCLGAPQRAQRMPEAPSALAQPEPDPACQGTVRQVLAAHALDRVVVGLALGADGKATVQFFHPDLTPAQADDLRRAMGSCLWTPEAPGDAGPLVWQTTFLGERIER
jgi:hypothetical protein